MTSFIEGDLQITFSNAKCARKFDDASHGLGHCMKAVDFVVELDDRYLFIEFKDPQNPLAKNRDQQRFIQQFQAGQIDEDLKYKYRDSFLYEWASGRASKPIYYYVLVALDSLDSADLIRRTDALKSKLPINAPPPITWTHPIVAGCIVFNIDAWNKEFPEYPVTRVSGN